MGGGWRSTSCWSSWTGSASPPFGAVLGRTGSTPSSTRCTSSREGRAGARCDAAARSRAPSRSTSSAPATSRSKCSTRRSRAQAGWAATSGSARRRRRTGSTSSTCTWARSTHEPDLDSDAAARRARADHQRLLAGDDRAGLLDGADDRPLRGTRAFGWEDIVDAMTTIESGTAQNIEYIPEETRAVAIHEAGHAAAGHVYMSGRALDEALDPQARRLARALPGAREGGAVQLLAPQEMGRLT